MEKPSVELHIHQNDFRIHMVDLGGQYAGASVEAWHFDRLDGATGDVGDQAFVDAKDCGLFWQQSVRYRLSVTRQKVRLPDIKHLMGDIGINLLFD